MGFQFVKKDISDYLVNGFNKQYLLKRMVDIVFDKCIIGFCGFVLFPTTQLTSVGVRYKSQTLFDTNETGCGFGDQVIKAAPT